VDELFWSTKRGNEPVPFVIHKPGSYLRRFFFHPLRRNVTGCQKQGISSGDGMRRCKSISHVQV
jgi:hypothetical protein